MFYEHNQVEDLLNCGHCGERFDVPLLLPCWKTCCQRCINKSLDKSTGGLNCPFCQTCHKIPVDGFVTNDTLASLLKLKPVDVRRAEQFKKTCDLFKQLQYNLDNLDEIETIQKTSLNKNKHLNNNDCDNGYVDYFEIVRNAIRTNTQSFIQETCRYRDNLLHDVDTLEKQSNRFISELFGEDTNLFELRRYAAEKKMEWQKKCADQHQNSEIEMQNILKEASELNEKLSDIKTYIQMMCNNKLVFNQPTKVETCSFSMIGEVEFNFQDFSIDHRIKVKLLNDLIPLRCVESLDENSLRLTKCIIPIFERRFLNVEGGSFDDITDISLTIHHFYSNENNNETNANKKKIKKTKQNKRLDLGKVTLNSINSHGNFIVIAITDPKTNKSTLQLFNLSFKLICETDLTFSGQHQPTEILLNNSNIYLRIDAHPFIIKYNYKLERQVNNEFILISN
jgi:hypothetical protein